MTRAYVLGAAWWDADVGPPSAESLPRAERIAASFSTRIFAHVLDQLAQRSAVPLEALPWVLGSIDAPPEPPRAGSRLRRVLAPTRGSSLVHAGAATVAMSLLEALGMLVEHEVVLVGFVHDAAPPHSHEPLAVALLLSRASGKSGALMLEVPVLRRTSAHTSAHSTRNMDTHPFAAARGLARATCVARPTVETVPSVGSDPRDHWRIELCRAL